ncbi:unnamed protein product [Penicillium manginii]
MAKARVKKRTHTRPQNASAAPKGGAAALTKTPKSMVIRVGASQVGTSVTQLVKDVRRMMEPDTAVRLKERKSNRLRDYTVMAGPLGVTHLMLFSKSKTGNTNMRLAVTPRGPTLHFQVENYSLCKDVERSMKRPQSGGQDHKTAPLLVMNNFNTADVDEDAKVPKRLEALTTTIFQSLFPPINPTATPLSSIRRVMLLNREPAESEEDDSYVLSLRHYAIATKKTGVSKRIRRLDPKEIRNREKKKAAVPNLGKLEDAADYLLDPSAAGYTSASETELDTDAEVEIAESTTRKILNKREAQRQKANEKGEKADKKASTPGVEKRAVKLVELGPRLKLRLMKVEDGVCDGKIMWHDYVTKSAAEVRKLDQNWAVRRKEKEKRKKEQKENIERKKKDKAKARANGEKVNDDEDDEDVDMDDENWLSDDFDDEGGDEDDSDESMEE